MLLAKLKQRIQAEGPITVEAYMAACLYDPEHGYYTTRTPIGTAGDFTTAPEMTQIFGELLAIWAADAWFRLGCPSPVTLLELGPGRGTLMDDVLRTLQKVAPDFYNAANVLMVEVSPHLQEVQKQKLAAYAPRITWAADIPEAFEMPVIGLANEFLDAFPHRQFDEKDGKFFERLVGLDDAGNLVIQTAENPTLPTPKTLEDSPTQTAYLKRLVHAIAQGTVLFIDYGGSGSAHTLQAVHKHQHVDILSQPGMADLTCHVNFETVRATLNNTVYGATPMGLFLMELGLPMRAAKLIEQAPDAATREEIATAVQRLVDPRHMGELFKVLAWQTPDVTQPPAGFRHDANHPRDTVSTPR